MKKILTKLESLIELKIIEVNQTKGVYAGSISYDSSTTGDTSTSYDNSTDMDTSGPNGDSSYWSDW
jgi:hypothetical protein